MRLKKVKGANDIIIKGKYYIPNPDIYKGKWKNLFNNNNPIHIEIGIGKGNFIIENAKKYKNINFIGIEKYDSVIVRAIQKSNELELSNLKLLRMDAKNLAEIFNHEINTIYLNFSDPWPKDRHSKRRLTSQDFLNIYNLLFKLTEENRIIMKTDNIDLFNYSIENLQNAGYSIIYKTNNLDSLSEDNIMTEYEKKFYNKGIKINKLIGIKNKQNGEN